MTTAPRTALTPLSFSAIEPASQLSGLPFSTLPPGVGDAIAAATFRALKPGGAFLAYQFSPKVRDFIAAQTNRIDHAFEVGNIPPCQLYWGWREG